MPIDWDGLVLGPTMRVFGEPVLYAPVVGSAFAVTAVFDNGFTEVDPVSQPGVLSAKPTLGIRLAEFPSGFDAKQAQGDRFTVLRTGVVYIVNKGEPDSHGHALLRANVAPPLPAIP